jgi:ankyrin repeat protein
MAAYKVSMKAIDEEFERLMKIRQIELAIEDQKFLKAAWDSLASKNLLDLRGPMNRSLIHYAAMGDCSELIRYLLLSNAAVDVRDRNKRTPLSWAAEYASLNVVKILLLNGAEINSTDDMYTTPLIWLLGAGPLNKSAETEAYLRKMGGKEKGMKRRWILKKLHLF